MSILIKPSHKLSIRLPNNRRLLLILYRDLDVICRIILLCIRRNLDLIIPLALIPPAISSTFSPLLSPSLSSDILEGKKSDLTYRLGAILPNINNPILNLPNPKRQRSIDDKVQHYRDRNQRLGRIESIFKVGGKGDGGDCGAKESETETDVSEGVVFDVTKGSEDLEGGETKCQLGSGL